MQTLEDDAKARFRMKRYMDDVITVTAKDDGAWDVDRFREDFRRSECYCVLGAFEVGGSRERSFFRERRLLRARSERRFPDETQERERGLRGRASGVALPSLGQLHMHAQR